MATEQELPAADRKKYERPQIVRHNAGYMNKYGRGSLQAPIKDIDGVALKELAAEFGTPLYVVSEATLARRFRDALRAFRNRYPKATFAWSYKTNYLKAVCATLHREGAYAEVVSGMEYEMARSLGVPGDQIIFNGPVKTEAALARAAREGARIHIDNFDELHVLEKVASSLGRALPVGIRVNLDAGIYPTWDRFGFNLENGQAMEAARRIHAARSLELKGLHCHIGTYILDPEAYRREVAKLLSFADQLGSEMGVEIAWLDTGGGFASNNTLHSSYLSGEHVVPSLNDYATCVTEPLLARYKTASDMPLLFLESGRALVDDAVSLLTSVVASSRLPSGRRALVMDAGVNNLITAWWFRHDLALTDDYTSFMEDTAVYGPLCMAIDVIRESVMLPPMGRGDMLLIKRVGAYNMTQWMQFIHERPAVVMISASGTPELIRRRETAADISGPELLPERLKLV